MYLMVRNPGIADWQGITMLGVSTTRYQNRAGTIGTFGSGTCNSLCLFLRNSIRPIYYCGNLKMEFYSEPIFSQGFKFNQVCIKYSGKDIDGTTKNNTDKSSLTEEWGVKDWNKLNMGLREIVSNAIDAAIISGGSFKDVELQIVDKPRAKAGYTACFLPYTPEIEKCYKQINRTFLHFNNPEALKSVLIPKQNPSEPDKILVYKRGVLVSYMNGISLRDFNFGDELTLDESRNASSYDVRDAAATAIKNASANDIASILKGIMNNPNVFEATLSSYNMKASSYDNEDVKKEKRERFQQAWFAVAGDKAVVTTVMGLGSFIRAKGYTPVHMPSSDWHDILESYGVLTQSQVLDKMEQKEHTTVPVTEEQEKALNWGWDLFVKYNMTNSVLKPELRSFRKPRDGGSEVNGQCDMEKGIIFLNADIGGTNLHKTVLHELVHHCSKSDDLSTDFCDYCLRLATLIAENSNA